MKISFTSYKIALGMIRKGLDRIKFSDEDVIDIIKYINEKYKNTTNDKTMSFLKPKDDSSDIEKE